MLNKLRYLLVGSPLPSEMLKEKRLNKIRALAAFSPDALSSVAYANQEIFLGLAIAGSVGLSFQFPIAIAIAVLLGMFAHATCDVQGMSTGAPLGTFPTIPSIVSAAKACVATSIEWDWQ